MFRSFFMAGFECATGINAHHEFIDQISATEHDIQLADDYRRVGALGIKVIREGVRWPLVDPNSGGYRMAPVRQVLNQATEYGLQLILDLFHYGYPHDIDIFEDSFLDRFTSYCSAIATEAKKVGDGPYYFTPVNEPSYFAWAAGDAARFRPHAHGRSFELKIQLARAAIQAIDAIREILPDARFVNVDPLCRTVAPTDRTDLDEEVKNFNENVVFQSWDMLSGRLFPELGGSPQHLDIVGLNYYWTNQWEHLRPESPLQENDPRCWPLRDLIRWVWHRYKHEMIISETAQIGRLRSRWITQASREAESVLDEGIPLKGVCLYPILGMPEWHDQSSWARMGMWDLHPSSEGLVRKPHLQSLRALKEAQSRLEGLSLERDRATGAEHALPSKNWMGLI